MTRFACPSCGKQLSAPKEMRFSGRSSKCRGCGYTYMATSLNPSLRHVPPSGLHRQPCRIRQQVPRRCQSQSLSRRLSSGRVSAQWALDLLAFCAANMLRN